MKRLNYWFITRCVLLTCFSFCCIGCCCFFFVEDSYNVRFDLSSGHPYSVFLLGDSTFKYTPSYDEVKRKVTLTVKKPQSKHKIDYWVNRVYQNIRDWNALPDFLISSAEGAEMKLTSSFLW